MAADISEIITAIDSSASIRSAVIERLVSSHAQETWTAIKASDWQA